MATSFWPMRRMVAAGVCLVVAVSCTPVGGGADAQSLCAQLDAAMMAGRDPYLINVEIVNPALDRTGNNRLMLEVAEECPTTYRSFIEGDYPWESDTSDITGASEVAPTSVVESPTSTSSTAHPGPLTTELRSAYDALREWELVVSAGLTLGDLPSAWPPIYGSVVGALEGLPASAARAGLLKVAEDWTACSEAVSDELSWSTYDSSNIRSILLLRRKMALLINRDIVCTAAAGSLQSFRESHDLAETAHTPILPAGVDELGAAASGDEHLTLQPDGLGLTSVDSTVVSFGLEPSLSIGLVSAFLGQPDSVSRWYEEIAPDGGFACAQAQIQRVQWSNLILFFTTAETPWSRFEGAPVFFGYMLSANQGYGAPSQVQVDLKTPEGLGIGSDVAEWETAYGKVQRWMSDDYPPIEGFTVAPDSFVVFDDERYRGQLASETSQPDGVVTIMSGGGCEPPSWESEAPDSEVDFAVAADLSCGDRPSVTVHVENKEPDPLQLSQAAIYFPESEPIFWLEYWGESVDGYASAELTFQPDPQIFEDLPAGQVLEIGVDAFLNGQGHYEYDLVECP